MKTSKLIRRLLGTVLLFTLCAQTVGAETLHLSVAASMTDVTKKIIAGFMGNHPDIRVLPNFASSGSLAKQIAKGAPADLYISANPKWMDFLLKEGMIAGETNRIFAYNKLVFIGRPENGPLTLGQVTKLQKIGIGTPQSVPAGQYAKQAMEKANIYETLEKARKLVMAKDVRQALLYAERGEVDGSFVYRTDALLAQKAKILFTVPGDLYDRVAYPLGLTVKGAKKDGAVKFYEYMGSEQATILLKEYGFEPAD
jgi:molybdate transport system substrate-binding protein